MKKGFLALLLLGLFTQQSFASGMEPFVRSINLTKASQKICGEMQIEKEMATRLKEQSIECLLENGDVIATSKLHWLNSKQLVYSLYCANQEHQPVKVSYSANVTTERDGVLDYVGTDCKIGKVINVKEL